MKSAVEYTLDMLNKNNTGYICVTDVGNLVNAHRKNPELKNAINNSLLSLPDGKPLSAFAKLKGIKEIERVAGPDFMENVFKATSGKNLSHFFLGDTDETLTEVMKKAKSEYKINVSGFYSPQFGQWTEEYNEDIIKRLNDSRSDFIWVSFGGGKQEIWMKNNYVKLHKGIMSGVGAAFRFYTGEISRAPLFMQNSGLEWLYRLKQQPEKMFNRYLTTLPYFIFYSFGEFFKKSN
ncbi:MAG: UDP-N-acetyl-D-mannosaminuronic acid transferase [Ignavibacteria bacterium]|nr:UDP-N-acetyl-D-mannosaminuronic acid transferase [Ignavibacteria bacterium]